MIRTVALLLAGLLVGPATADEAGKKALESLQGTWTIETLEYNGKDMSGRYKLSLVIKDGTVTVEGNKAIEKEYAKLGLKLDPSTTPKCLDLSIVLGAQKDTVMEGIYEVKGDELKLCIKVIGKERPGKFASPEGESIALLTLKRQK